LIFGLDVAFSAGGTGKKLCWSP